MMSQEITLNEFEVFYFMKKGLEGILTVNSGLPEYLFFSHYAGWKDLVSSSKKVWKLPSKSDIINLEPIQAWVIVCTTL